MKRHTKKELAKPKQTSWEEWQRRSSEPMKRVDIFRIAKKM